MKSHIIDSANPRMVPKIVARIPKIPTSMSSPMTLFLDKGSIMILLFCCDLFYISREGGLRKNRKICFPVVPPSETGAAVPPVEHEGAEGASARSVRESTRSRRREAPPPILVLLC